MVNHGGNRYRVTLCVYTNRRDHTDFQVMDIGATSPVNDISWRQAAELRYQKLMESTQREERRQRVEQLNTTLYIAKNGKIEMQRNKAPNNINFLV